MRRPIVVIAVTIQARRCDNGVQSSPTVFSIGKSTVDATQCDRNGFCRNLGHEFDPLRRLGTLRQQLARGDCTGRLLTRVRYIVLCTLIWGLMSPILQASVKFTVRDLLRFLLMRKVHPAVRYNIAHVVNVVLLRICWVCLRIRF